MHILFHAIEFIPGSVRPHFPRGIELMPGTSRLLFAARQLGHGQNDSYLLQESTFCPLHFPIESFQQFERIRRVAFVLSPLGVSR